MTDVLRCPFCEQTVDGLTLYSVAGVFRLLVCASCYGLLVAKEHQPHSKPMKRLHWLLGLNGREVVSDEGAEGCDTPVAGGSAHRGVVRQSLAAGGGVRSCQQKGITHGTATGG